MIKRTEEKIYFYQTFKELCLATFNKQKYDFVFETIFYLLPASFSDSVRVFIIVFLRRIGMGVGFTTLLSLLDLLLALLCLLHAFERLHYRLHFALFASLSVEDFKLGLLQFRKNKMWQQKAAKIVFVALVKNTGVTMKNYITYPKNTCPNYPRTT